MIEVKRIGEGVVELRFFEWDRRVRVLVGKLRIRWSEFLEYGDVVNVFVNAGSRRENVGRALMFAALNHLRREGIHRVFAELPGSSGLEVVRYFQAMGFEKIKVPSVSLQYVREIPMRGELRIGEVFNGGGAA